MKLEVETGDVHIMKERADVLIMEQKDILAEEYVVRSSETNWKKI